VILSAIGALDRVVACTRYCADVVPEAADGSRTILADSWTANAAAIISARPDLVIASVPYQEKSVSEILKSGVPVLALAPHRLADIYTDIAMIAGLVGAADRGEELIDTMERRIDEVRIRTKNLPRPRVFCEEWGKPLIASQPWVAELVEAAGGDFLGTPARQIDADEVLHLDPEVIVAAWCGAGDRVPLEKIIPPWIPGRVAWAYLAGAVLLVAGAALVINWKAQKAATYMGIMILLLMLFVYLPLLVASPTDLEALNYFFDTLLFCGTILVLADALRERTAAR